MTAATVAVEACELDGAITALRAAAQAVAALSTEVTQRVPVMLPWLEAEMEIELWGARAEMMVLAGDLLADAAVQEGRLLQFELADAAAEVSTLGAGGARATSVVAGGLAAMPAAVAADFGDGRRNFQVNFQELAIAALRPWANADYLTTGIGFGPLVGVQVSVSYSRSGYAYITPGLNIGTPGFGLYGGAGHVNTKGPASQAEIDSLLEGATMAAGAFAVVGATAVSSPRGKRGAQTGYETGFGTPQGELSASRGYRLPFQKGPSW